MFGLLDVANVLIGKLGFSGWLLGSCYAVAGVLLDY